MFTFLLWKTYCDAGIVPALLITALKPFLNHYSNILCGDFPSVTSERLFMSTFDEVAECSGDHRERDREKESSTVEKPQI